MVECGRLSVRRGYERILNNTEVKLCCVDTLWWLPESAALVCEDFSSVRVKWGKQTSRQTPGGTKTPRPPTIADPKIEASPRQQSLRIACGLWNGGWMRTGACCISPSQKWLLVSLWIHDLQQQEEGNSNQRFTFILFQDVPKQEQVNYSNTKTIVIHEMITVDGFNTDILILLTRTEHPAPTRKTTFFFLFSRFEIMSTLQFYRELILSPLLLSACSKRQFKYLYIKTSIKEYGPDLLCTVMR